MEKVTMTVRDVSQAMGLSLPKAYALAKSSKFPTIRVGRRLIIPTHEFHAWLSEQSGKSIDLR